MLRLILFLCTVCSCWAEVTGTYIAYKESSLSTSTEKITVQQVSSGTRDIRFISASLWCDADATFTLTRTGTAASATTLTTIRINPWQSTSTATAWSGSNVGTGTTIRAYAFKSGSPELVLALDKIIVPRSFGTTGNISIGTNTITATCRISILWEEIR